MNLDIEITWTTIDRQGPHYKPFTTRDTVYFSSPILKTDIEKMVHKAYPSWFIYEVKIIEQEKTFIVTSDHPFYPSIEYCKNIEQAREVYQKEISEMEDKNGNHVLKIAITEVIELTETRSCY